MATLNEEARIEAKLADLARTDYPRERLRIVIVDGGSTDGTLAHIEAACRAGAPIELMRAPQAGSKLEQLRCGLEAVHEDLVVTTDADADLDPSCVRSLVEVLLRDPSTAVVGARIRPHTDLLEERIYWWFLNTLWWLEGEALSAAVVSGVCYAVRRRVVLAAPRAAGADDVLFALAAGAYGHGVRLCRGAWAVETRVPHSPGEFIVFRRRRGAGYMGALRASLPAAGISGWRLARAIRLFHFLVTPALLSALAVMGLVLCCTSHWPSALLIAALFAAPMLAALFGSTTLAALSTRRWQLGASAVRLAALIWLALLTPAPRPRPVPVRADVAAETPVPEID
jgi:cellulose synthase/poly-beta-1,6-N-acetylglucosamine synthase-like glycosyltransferase